MNAYYRVTKELERILLEDEDVNTVTKGKDIDVNKKDIFPLCHVEVIDVEFSEITLTFNVRVTAMDIRNHSNVPTNDKFIGNDNEDDNLNTMLYVLYRLFLRLQRSDEFTVISFGSPTVGQEVGNNFLDGWIWDFKLQVIENDISGC